MSEIQDEAYAKAYLLQASDLTYNFLQMEE